MKTLPTKVKLSLSSLALLSAAIVSPNAWAHDDCTPYTAELHLEGISPFGPLGGIGTYHIGDQAPQVAQVTAVLKGSASLDPGEPVVEISFSDMVLFPPGTDGTINILTAVDHAVGTTISPGVIEARTKSRITGGVGLYEGVSGKASSTNTTQVDLATGFTKSDIKVHGKLCGIGEANQVH